MMSYKKEIEDKIFNELSLELESLSFNKDGEPVGFDDLEEKVLNIGSSIERRLLKEVIKYQESKYAKKKLSSLRRKS